MHAAPGLHARCRQLDFWIGRWRGEWDNPDGTTGAGESHITRDAFGGRAVYQRFSAPGLKGISTTAYLARSGLWRQVWVDDSGGFHTLTGGPGGKDSPYDFVLTNTRPSPVAPILRMVWQDVTADSFIWRWQGRISEAEDWADRWVIRYARMAE